MSVGAVFLALLLDRMLSEPSRWHPLVGFGRWASWLEMRLNTPRKTGRLSRNALMMGTLAWLAAVVPIVLPVLWLYGKWPEGRWLMDAVAGYLCIALQSLKTHLGGVYRPLVSGDLAAAQAAVARIVSRETQALDAQGVRKAAIESTLENGADAVFAPMFWLLVGGAPAVILHRLANTLDAMWGYRNPRFLHFGRCAARLDDVLNWLPARLTALSFSLLGNRATARRAWRMQAALCASPNAGPVMTAGAGSLGIELGGTAVYHGRPEARPAMGFGSAPDNADLLRALQLVQRVVLLWCAALVIGWLAWLLWPEFGRP